MAELTYRVPAIHCDGCANTITQALEPVEGVEGSSVDLQARTVRVSGSPDDRVIRKVLTSAGYPPA